MKSILKKNSRSSILILDKINKEIQFKRIFFLIANTNVQRGKHAHKKCTQAFFSVKGSFCIECISPDKRKRKFILKPGGQLKIIKPQTWVTVFLKKNDVCGVLCDKFFDNKDYIRDYKKFISFNHNDKKNKI